MSEYQNNAVELLKHRFGEESLMDREARRAQFLEEALELFRAMGGSAEMVRSHAAAAYARPRSEVIVKIGDVMTTLAGVAIAHDVDVVQAGYNSLDAGWREVGVTFDRRAKRQF